MSSDFEGHDRTARYEPLAGGTEISQYRIVERIGFGGMGEVYLASDSRLNRRVALKFLPSHLCQDPECRKRFTREAQAAAGLDHPNIAGVYEVGDYAGRPYYAMQLVQGRSLRQLLDAGELPLDQVVEIGEQVCDALQFAHEHGIIHRDIKPSNILLDDRGRVRLVDFGLASVRGSEHLTEAGSTFGTIGYMSPEQVRGESVDHRSDLFSLGVVLYEMVAGAAPFIADNTAAVLARIIGHTPPPLSERRTELPDELEVTIDRALAKAPDDRFQSGSDLRRQLTAVREKLAQQSQTDKDLSIAVLPFTNLSSDPEQDYFCDGITEEIINVLTQLKHLRVVARTSCFAFKGKTEDIRSIGRKLDVTHLLEGSVRKSGNRLRITGQLIKVSDGFHLWSEKFDRNLEDIFAVQDEISLAIVDRLKLKLAGSEKEGLMRRYTDNVEAYNRYLKARYWWNRRSGKGLLKALELLEQARELDPHYALVYTGLADCYSLLPGIWQMSPREAFPKAKAAALKALALDGELAEAVVSLAFVTDNYEWNWPKARQLYKRAIALNPSYPTAHHWYALHLLTCGEYEEALRESHAALRLDPLSIPVHSGKALCEMALGRIDDAEQSARSIYDIEPDAIYYHDAMGDIDEHRGNYADALEHYLAICLQKDPQIEDALFSQKDIDDMRAAFETGGRKAFIKVRVMKLIEASETVAVEPTEIATDLVELGEYDEAFAWLHRAVDARDNSLRFIGVNNYNRRLDVIRKDPRFRAILDRIENERIQ